MSHAYLNKMRTVGGGPTFIKLGPRVLYDPADLSEWVQQYKRTSTSDAGRAVA